MKKKYWLVKDSFNTVDITTIKPSEGDSVIGCYKSLYLAKKAAKRVLTNQLEGVRYQLWHFKNLKEEDLML